jgi:hypothetical protein
MRRATGVQRRKLEDVKAAHRATKTPTAELQKQKP